MAREAFGYSKPKMRKTRETDIPYDIVTKFDHPDGHVQIGLDAENNIYLTVDGEQHSRHQIDTRFSEEAIRGTLEFESQFWAGQERPLEEIDYNIEQLEKKLVQWPYKRDKR